MSNFDDIFDIPARRKKVFDKAAWGERKQAQRQAVFDLADATALDVVKDGSKFQAYLDLQSRFHRYTSTNALLILAQMPNATRIKDYDGWNDSGVSIKKHQKGFSILEPGDPYTREDGSRGTSYNVKKVFDISQTTAKPEPAAPAPDERTLLRALIHKPPVAVVTVDSLPGNLGALYDHDAKTLSVRRGMAAPDIFRSVSMELAHAELGAGDGYVCNSAALTAYSVSYLLCRQYGIDASGWAAVLVVVVICLIGLIASSSYGIFFSGEDTGSGQTMRSVVQEINDEYLATLDSIKTLNPHDKLEMSGSRAVWPEVLAVYAVKTTTDPDHPQDVVSITDEKKELLREIFWQMNSISFRTATVSEIQYIETDDGSGNIVSEEITVTQTCLYITVSHKTALEIAVELGFAGSQTEQLEALLADENDTLWTAVLYGITSGDGQLIEVARSQIGNVGGQPYWSWYGFNSRVAWCACFVSWCANECGYIEAGVIPKFASCANGVQWFHERGQWADNSIEPTPGMLIFFDWNGDGHSDHVGIVERCEGSIVHTIEGNTNDSCRERSYAVGHHQIQGYGIPAY